MATTNQPKSIFDLIVEAGFDPKKADLTKWNKDNWGYLLHLKNGNNWPADSHCGKETKKILTKTKALLKTMDMDPSCHQAIWQGVIEGILIICFG
jgi:hypothetical protein